MLGAEGKQLICYTPVKTQYLPPKAPAGGGFGLERYSLNYLYEEYKFHNNIWTVSNINKDLCRYLFCKFIFYRDPRTDFIVSYSRNPPFDLTKYTYPACHPHQMLLDKHHRVVFSTATKPLGPIKTVLKIKPPRQMITKWFFTSDFSKYTLALIKAAACNFRCSYLSCSNRNQLVNITYLQLAFYANADWGKYRADAYKPYDDISTTISFEYKTGNTTKTYTPHNPGTSPPKGKTAFDDYDTSVSYDWGWFSPKVLASTKVTNGTTVQTQAITPVTVARYNPNTDNGKGNKIWLKSILSSTYQPPTDQDLILEGFPLWLGLYGFISWIVQAKHEKNYLKQAVILLQSPSILPYSDIGQKNIYLPLDSTFIAGKAPYDEYLNENMKLRWWPTVDKQMQTLNAIVESGPFIPNYSEQKESNWELKYRYCFYFKWGGPQMDEPQVADPKSFPQFDVPDQKSKTVQIINPEKQTAQSLMHAWDVRRGIITKKAFKRMLDNIETDTEFEPVTESIQAKRPRRVGPQLITQEEEEEKIKTCLHSLCEESICQEEESQNLHLLIKQQQEQQQQLKYNILALLSDLKMKQRMLQLQTGLLE